MTYFYT